LLDTFKLSFKKCVAESNMIYFVLDVGNKTFIITYGRKGGKVKNENKEDNKQGVAATVT